MSLVIFFVDLTLLVLLFCYLNSRTTKNWFALFYFREGQLEDRRIEFEVPIPAPKNTGGPEGFEVHPAAQDFMKRVTNSFKQGVEKKNMKVSDAREVLEELESEKLVDQVDIKKEAIRAVEESGIIVLDEIDKIVSHGDSRGSDASAEGT